MSCDKKTLKFNLSNKDLKIKELISGDFLELEVYAINDDYPNRNNSHFTLESMQDAIPTFYNKPVLGAFNTEIGPDGDFEGHNDNGLHYDPELDELYYDYTSSDSEIPLGLIRESDSVAITYDEKNKKNWLKLSCCLWCKYNFKAIKSLLKSRKGFSKISVEIEVLKSHVDEKGIEVIDKFALMGFTILGQKVAEGIENAHLSVLDLMENSVFQKKQQALRYAYSALEDYTKDSKENSFEEKTDEPISQNITNEGEENIEMNQEGGRLVMLTYETKRGLIEAYLQENLNSENCYVYVCDLDNDTVYFWFDGHYYRANYTISTNEQEENVVEVNLAEKQEVIRSWTDFEAEKVEENKDTETENAATEEDKRVEAKDTETENAATEENKEVEAKDTDAEENKENKVEKEACDKPEEKFTAESIDLNTEPDTTDAEENIEKNIETSIESISAPETQDVGKSLGEGSKETNTDTVVVIEHTLTDVKEEVSVAPDGQKAEVVEKAEDEGKIEQPDDEKKSEIFTDNSTNTVIKETDKVENFEVEPETIEVDGAKVNINELFNRYTTLRSQYDELQENIKKQNASHLVEFGKNFIESDEDVDVQSKKNYVNQVTEKCKSYELNTEEEVTNFAKGLLAMYYYENKVTSNKKSSTDFSISIERPSESEEISHKNNLKEAISKLNRI